MKNKCPEHTIAVTKVKCNEVIILAASFGTSVQKVNEQLDLIKDKFNCSKSLVEGDIKSMAFLDIKPLKLHDLYKPPKKNFVNKFNKNQHRK